MPSLVIKVTLGLSLAGAVVGATLGALSAVVASISSGALQANGPGQLPVAMVFGAIFGAPIGAVLGPLAAWLLMRRVPIGRAIAGTAIGVVVGFALMPVIPGTFLGPIGGFFAAAILLRIESSRGRIRLPAE